MGASQNTPSPAMMGALVFISVIPALLFLFVPTVALAHQRQTGITRRYTFYVRLANVTRLCHRKSIVTVNGRFPGPRVVAREGDRLLIRVVNRVHTNVTLHWHGVRQLRSGWADGPAYIAQCPVRPGQAYVYNFTVVGQRGTLWWHAHISWLRTTLYGPIIILPKLGDPYPFAKPYKEVPILFGEWWHSDTEAVIGQALQNGGGPNVSDAYTINGLPGPLYNCSSRDTFKLKVKPGKSYLLRIVNAALNDDLFFAIAGHNLTVVEADAVYVKPFVTDTIMVTPGQSTNVLLHTGPPTTLPAGATFVMAARPYVTGHGTFGNSTTAGLLQYYHDDEPPTTTTVSSSPSPPLFLQEKEKQQQQQQLFPPDLWYKPISLPSLHDTAFVASFASKFRSLASPRFPAAVPRTVDRHFLFTVGLGATPCPENRTCQGPHGSKLAAAVNNISFTLPATALLQAHYTGQSRGVYLQDFPSSPTHPFNYTGTPPNNTLVKDGTRLVVLPFNAAVELVMQDTSILGGESHPLHLHGFNFFVVGRGFGNFDPSKDPASYNLVDPVERNTVGVPIGGWVAIRFRADNPGVWFMHCHFEVHTSWGLRMAWVVLDGALPHQKLLPPPADLPQC